MEYKGLYNKISPEFSPSTLGGSSQPSVRKPINQNGNANHYYSDWKSRKSTSSEETVSTKTTKENINGNGFVNNKVVRIAIIVVVVIIVLIGVSRLLGGKSNSSSTPRSQDTQVKGVIAESGIEKEFTFPLLDESGEEAANFKYLISSAELRDEIVVQGQKATAIEGRGFLIVNLKITNDNDQPIELNTRDYVRLSINGDKEVWLAPDIHNDKVEVQAISTKNTRLGFPISDSDTQLVLRVGEIDGEKEEIEISFNN